MLPTAGHGFFGLSWNNNVKLLRGGKHPIPNLTEGDVQAVTDVDKVIAKCWNYSDDPLPLSPQCCVDSEPLLPDDMRCTNDDVHHFLCSMDPSKENGPDGVS